MKLRYIQEACFGGVGISSGRSDSVGMNGRGLAAAPGVSGLVSFAVLTALAAGSARFEIPLVPVPVTLQVFFVMLSGMVLGARMGAGSQLLYLCLGAFGLPVFAAPPNAGPACFVGPTGGYLFGFVAAALVCGLTAAGAKRMRGTSRIGTLALAGVTGLLTLYAFGAGWLAIWLTATGACPGPAASSALRLGVEPFIFVDLLKVAAAAMVAGALTSPATARTLR